MNNQQAIDRLVKHLEWGWSEETVEPFIGYWDGREWTDEEVDILDEVIAWMPLPEPYKEVEDGN
ncbi:Uncharacterised protein [uncultured Coprococcus sp.]|nr:hypothetical protein [uncultured Coprococcus sp.]SCH18159.1 Uncharacterised protein [uncultured Coprococcus sp.]